MTTNLEKRVFDYSNYVVRPSHSFMSPFQSTYVPFREQMLSRSNSMPEIKPAEKKEATPKPPAKKQTKTKPPAKKPTKAKQTKEKEPKPVKITARTKITNPKKATAPKKQTKPAKTSPPKNPRRSGRISKQKPEDDKMLEKKRKRP